MSLFYPECWIVLEILCYYVIKVKLRLWDSLEVSLNSLDPWASTGRWDRDLTCRVLLALLQSETLGPHPLHLVVEVSFLKFESTCDSLKTNNKNPPQNVALKTILSFPWCITTRSHFFRCFAISLWTTCLTTFLLSPLPFIPFPPLYPQLVSPLEFKTLVISIPR